jgi:hypothetical protein
VACFSGKWFAIASAKWLIISIQKRSPSQKSADLGVKISQPPIWSLNKLFSTTKAIALTRSLLFLCLCQLSVPVAITF